MLEIVHQFFVIDYQWRLLKLMIHVLEHLRTVTVLLLDHAEVLLRELLRRWWGEEAGSSSRAKKSWILLWSSNTRSGPSRLSHPSSASGRWHHIPNQWLWNSWSILRGGVVSMEEQPSSMPIFVARFASSYLRAHSAFIALSRAASSARRSLCRRH